MHPEGEAQAPATIIAPGLGVRARQGMAWLEHASGERRYVQSEMRIGRGEQNDLRLNDASVSRYHAFLRRVDGRYLLSDVGSQNGTFVNGRQVHAPSALDSGDRIRAGTTELTFHLDVPSDSPANADDPATLTSITSSGTMLQEYVQGDLRIVTVLFLDLHGFTAMSEGLQPDEVTQIMNRCFERLTATVARFGGYVDKYVGDAMMVLFGAPVAHADDPERAVRAAMALQDELGRFNQSQRSPRKANVNLQMRIGINTGEVLAGRVGGGEFGQYTVMGDAVNLASRLEHAARVGHVLVGETTHRFTRQVIRYVALPPMSIRGKAEPVQTYEVVGLYSHETSVEAAMDSTFVGRQRELTRLGELITGSPSGFQSATIVAPASAGKSSLLTELHRRHAGDARWALARCSEYDRGTPYMALRQLTLHILRSSGRGFDVLQGSPSEATGAPLAALAQLLSPNVERKDTGIPEAGRLALATAFTHLLTENAVRECLVMTIDGVQWIDFESLAVLDAVVPDLEDARVVLITTARPEWRHTWPNEVLTVHLEPFSLQDCTQFVSFLLRSTAVAPATIDILARESDGNPLLLAEMVRSGVESGGLSEQDGEWRLQRRGGAVAGGGVDALRSIIQARLDQLSSDERRVLQVAAVLGQNWTGSLLARVLDENLPVPDLLRALAEREYLVQEMGGEEPGYSFAHTITQEVAYASLPHTGRERLHERVGRVLEEQFDPVRPSKVALRELVHHFMRGSSRDRAAQYLLYAADAGAGFADDAWAIATYRTAFEFAQKARDRTRRRALELNIQERLGDALLRQSSLADAQVAFEAASEVDDSKQRTGQLKAKLAHVASRQGNHARVLAVLRSALEAPDLDPHARATLEARAALSLCVLGQLREADERVTRAIALTEGASEGEALELALAASGALHYLRGDLGQARSHLERAHAIRRPTLASEAANDVQIGLSQTCYALGDVDAAMRILEHTLVLGGTPAKNEAPDGARLAETDGAGVLARRDPRDRWSFVSAEVLLGRVWLERGVIDRAREYFDDVLVRGQRIGAREVVLVARLCLAHAALAAGRPAEAAELARTMIAAAEALKFRPLVCDAQALLSAALVQTGGFAEAAEVARESVVRARTLHLPVHEAVSRRALGRALVYTGDALQGRKHLEAAAVAFEQMGAQLEWARTMAVLAELKSSPDAPAE
ncbi:MAG TPA: adenylate/guanylate cyclase domain-containing protein [Chloroflexota bacterium]|nr:adenylate/guanylate cyclase domain-containing protein [Chloroflexota bacterium]